MQQLREVCVAPLRFMLVWPRKRPRRRPERRPRYEERWICPTQAAARTSFESLATGHSVFIVPSLVSPDECEVLLAAAAAFRNAMSSTLRLPVLKLERAEQRLCDAILRRALAIVEADLPRLASLLFGRESELAAMQFAFSQGEPAVNIYTEGGEFQPHEDKQALTVLVPLSPDDAFSGGGTAFWEEDRGRFAAWTNEPTAVLRPPRGTAILFGGDVTHAGRPVLSGVRGVFVASFSLQPLTTLDTAGAAASAPGTAPQDARLLFGR